jgi:uncharacterized protein
MPDFDISGACAYAEKRLAAELSPALSYHSLAHTRDDVVPAARRLAAMEGIGGELVQLLHTAAWFHDIGFIKRRTGHEETSAAIAATALPRFGYSAGQVAIVVELILATQVPQQPRTQLAMALVDADMDSLGRDDFMATSQALREELAAFKQTIAEPAWLERQLRLLRSHRYFTPSARALRDAQKARNIALLERLLGSAPGRAPR